MNDLNNKDFQNENYNISFSYILNDGSHGSMGYNLSYILKNPAADLNIILKTALFSDTFSAVYERIADFIEFSRVQNWIKPDKLDSLKKVLNKYTPDGFRVKPEKKTAEARVLVTAERIAKKLFKFWNISGGRRFKIDGENIYIITQAVALRIPTSCAGLYIDVISAMDENEKKGLTISAPERLTSREERVCRVEYISTISGGDTFKKIKADYYKNGESAVLIDEKYSKIFKDFIFYTVEGTEARKIPVYIASPEINPDGSPIIEGVILPLFWRPWEPSLISAGLIPNSDAKPVQTPTTAENAPENVEPISSTAEPENSENGAKISATAGKTETPAKNVIPRDFYEIKAESLIETNYLKAGDIFYICKNPEGSNYIGSTATGSTFYIFGSHIRNANIIKILDIQLKAPEAVTAEPAEADPDLVKPEPLNNEDGPKMNATTAEAEPIPDINSDITLKDALLFLAMNKKSNTNLILSAALEAGVADLEDFRKYALEGITPRFHTFEAWKESNYIVQKGQKAAFSAMIWKRIEKKNENGDSISKYFLKKSFFFTADQVKPISAN